MFTIVDFETDGFEGPITELVAVDENRKVIANINKKELYLGKSDDKSNYNINVIKFFNSIVKDGNVIIFWHHFMPLYLKQYFPYIMDDILKGKFVIFTDFYAIFDRLKQPRYRIADITMDLTGREHKGNALDDALDLYDCFKITQ